MINLRTRLVPIIVLMCVSALLNENFVHAAQPKRIDDSMPDGSKINISKFFLFKDQQEDSAETKNLLKDFQIRKFSTWSSANKNQITSILKNLVKTMPEFLEFATFSGSRIRIYCTTNKLKSMAGQNVAETFHPMIGATDHGILITEELLNEFKAFHGENAEPLLAHEIAHLLDVNNCMSQSPKWLRSELPKLKAFRKRLRRGNASDKTAKRIAQHCGLPSDYAGRNAHEDFAETFAAYVVHRSNGTIHSTSENLVKRMIFESYKSKNVACKYATLAMFADLKNERPPALDLITKAINLAPDTGVYYFYRTQYRGLDKDIQKNLQDLLKAASLFKAAHVPAYDNDFYLVHRDLSALYYHLGQYEHENYELTILARSTSGAQIWSNLALNVLNLNEPQLALKYANLAIKNDKLRSSNYVLRARCLAAQGNYSQALQDYNLVLNKDPENQQALFGKGLCLLQQNAVVSAKSVWLKLLKINPKVDSALTGLAWIDFKLGNYELAIQEADRAEALYPNATNQAITGYCLVKLKKYVPAADVLTSVIAKRLLIKDDMIESYLSLAEAQNNLGRRTDAQKSLRAAAQLQHQ